MIDKTVPIDTSHPVLVTGATGYVAGWLVKSLLEAGCTVHATVRDASKKDELKYLTDIADKNSGTLRFFEADLLKEGSFAEAMQGCSLVYHTASPFTLKVADPQKDLIEPAQLGTRNVLEQAKKTDSVKRVVVTSSCAAVYGDTQDLQNKKGDKFTEADWNETSSLTHIPYSYSKTLAEREAWKIAESQDKWRLVVINPSLVVGPGLNPMATSETFNLFTQFGDGTMKAGLPDLRIGAVDVRDVVDAHIAAGFLPDAQGRHITSAQEVSFLEMAKYLQKHFGNQYPFPKRRLPKWLISMIGPAVDKSMSRKFIKRNVGFPLHLDNSKSRQELGITYRPVETAAVELFQQLIDSGRIKKA